jgi:regulator of protease activity HflC (stomatin/prohibitin superfamily)
MNMNGDDRGVEQIPTENGWVWFNPITQKVYVYPVFVQTAVWTRDKNEGSPNNEEISFNTSDGSVVTCDVSLSYALDPQKVPAFYVKFRSDDLNIFTHGFLRNVTRDMFNETASHYKVEDVYGEKKEEFLVSVRERVNKFMQPYGVKLEQMGTIGPMRIPQIVLDALNLKLAAMQTAMKIENEVRQREAEAKKMQVDAEAYAKKIKTEAEANAEANRMMNNSITPILIQWETIKKWNGATPNVVGAGNTMIQIPKF